MEARSTATLTRWKTIGQRLAEAAEHIPSGQDRHHASLETARSPDAQGTSQQEAEIEGAAVHQQAFQDVRSAAQMRAALGARPIEMRKWTLDPLPTLTHQRLSSKATEAATIGINGGAAAR